MSSGAGKLRIQAGMTKAVVLVLEAMISGVINVSCVRITDPEFESLSSGNGRNHGHIGEIMWAQAA